MNSNNIETTETMYGKQMSVSVWDQGGYNADMSYIGRETWICKRHVLGYSFKQA